jgi:ATP-binding cassette subfamily B protein
MAVRPMRFYDPPQRPAERDWRKLPGLIAGAFRLVRPAAPRQVAVVSVLQVVSALGLASQLLVGSKVVAAVLAAERGGEAFSSVAGPLAAFLAISAAMSFVTTYRGELTRVLTELVNREAMDRVIDVAVSVDLEAFDHPSFHDRLQRAQMAAMSRPWTVVRGLVELAGSLLGVVGLVVALAALSPVLLPLVLLGYVPLWVATVRNSESHYRTMWGLTQPERQRSYLGHMLTQKGCAGELRAFDLGRHLRARYDRLWDARIAELRGLARLRLHRSLWATVASSALAAATYAALVALLLADHLSVAAAVPAAVAVQQLNARLGGIANGVASLYESGLFLDDLNSFLDLAPAVAASRPTDPAPRRPASIVLDHVTFTYPDGERPALEDVCLEVRAGEVVALVGENGSGKSTLAKLLCHLYQPSAGRILWGGVDTAGCDPATVRRQVAVIFQDFVHYFLTARENVGVGDCARIDDLDAIVAASRRSGADGFLAALPEGYESTLGRAFDHGCELSIGQWQRVALARAFFRDAPLVILDEPTAALDARAEAELFDRIREMAEGRTVLLISHRFSSVRTADRIVVLHDGRVAEVGTHDQLLAAGGRYADLFNLQAAAYLAEPA